MLELFRTVLLFGMMSGVALGQGVQNVTVLSRLDLTHHIDSGGSIADVWGFTKEDKEFAVVGLTETGVTIIDVTDPYNPVEASVIPIPPGASRLYHVKPYKNYLYAVMRPGPLQIIDMSDPYNAFEVTTYSTGFDEAYGIFISDTLAHLYDVESSREGVSYIILDISNPESPAEIGTWFRTYHHVYTRNDSMFGFVLGGDVDFVDVSDPGSFSLLKQWEAGSKCHSGWLNDSGTILTTDHETPGGHMKVWDIPTNGTTPTLISEFETSTNQTGEATLHHTRFYNDYVYTSYWIEGFRLIDLSTPALPLEIAVYDTIDPNPDTMYRGIWGTYPYNPSRNILSTDAKQGLIILDYPDDGPGMQHHILDSLVAGGQTIRGGLNSINGTAVNVGASSLFWRTTHNGIWQQSTIDSSGESNQYFFELALPAQSSTFEYYLQIEGVNGRKTKIPGLAPHLEYYTSSLFNPAFSNNDVYISEVSDAANSANEFIEIHNLSGSAIDLEGFKLVQFAAGSDLRNNKSAYVYDLGLDESSSSSTIIPANGFLIIAREANQTGFELEWGSLPLHANFNSGNSSLHFGEADAYRWAILSPSNRDKADGVYIDDSGDQVAGTGLRSYQVSVGNWTTTNFTAASPGALDNDQSLPVSLVSFEAKKEENGVLLSWQTRSETNNLGFSIFRSDVKNDGFYPIADYTISESLKGLGTNSHGKEYSYFDNVGISNSVLFYKLQQNDHDGTTEEYGPLSIDFSNQDLPDDFEVEQNFPNPFNIETVLGFNIPDPKRRVTITIYSISGKEVRTIDMGTIEAGYYTYLWSGKNNNNEVVPSGVYIYSINFGKSRISKKMVLIK